MTRCAHGMTLLEVIVAMVLLSVGIASVLGAISSCLRSSEASTEYSHGALLAQQVASELERNETLETGEFSGEFDDEGSNYSWTATIADADEQGLYPAHIAISWRNNRRHYTMETVLRPHTLPGPAAPENDTGGGDGERPGASPENPMDDDAEGPDGPPGGGYGPSDDDRRTRRAQRRRR